MTSATQARCWRALLALWLLHCPLSTMARAETRHVLLLSSSERPFAPQSGFADALMPELIRASPEPIDFVEMSVQDARSSGLAPDLSIAQRLRSAFGAQRLDLVITVGGPAATFAQQFRQQLFPTAPILIAGVDRRFVENGTFTDNETTVATQHEPARMIDEILRLLPETRTVMVVIGASLVERFWLQEMKREFGRFEGRLQFLWTNELSFAEIMERGRTLPAQSAIFFAVLSLDAKGDPQAGGEALTSLYAVANAPMFALYGLGRGIVGGPLLDTDELSRTTARVALRMLSGESPHGIKTPVQRAGPPTFDWRELQRWNVDESRLSAGSIVLYREPPLWQRDKRPVILGVLVAAVPAVGIVLLVKLVKQRRAKSRRAVAANLLRGPADATVTIWTAGADGRRADAGHAPDDAWMASVHPDDLRRCLEIYRRAFAQREPFQMEYRVRDDDGNERWILDTGLPTFSGKDFEGYVGSAVDITRLGCARAELSNLSRRLMQAHERERAIIAKKLHQDVCQQIMALTLRLRGLKAAPHDGETQAVIADISEKLASLVGEIVAVPDPVYQKLELLGLATACRRLCQELSAQYQVAVHFQHENVPAQLPSDIALALFRVSQEATLNAVVHSGASDVWVALRGTADEVRLQIVDWGLGFDTQRDVPGGGVGLVAIRERLKLVNGGSAVVSRPGEGTRVEAWVPLRPQG